MLCLQVPPRNGLAKASERGVGQHSGREVVVKDGRSADEYEIGTTVKAQLRNGSRQYLASDPELCLSSRQGSEGVDERAAGSGSLKWPRSGGSSWTQSTLIR